MFHFFTVYFDVIFSSKMHFCNFKLYVSECGSVHLRQACSDSRVIDPVEL